MGKHKILHIVCIAVLSFHIRKSQSRSLNDDEPEHKIIEKTGNVADWKRECFCFPKTESGTPLLKFLPVNDEQERLVVYLYKNSNSNELTYFIPSWEKQSIFPKLKYDEIGIKLETFAPDGINNLLNDTKVPVREERTTVANTALTDDQFNVTVTTEVPDLENLSVPISGSSHHSAFSLKDINSNVLIEIPPDNVAESVIWPDTAVADSYIINGVNLNPDVNSSIGKEQQPVNGTSIDYSEKPNEPSGNQNQQTLDTLDDLYTRIIPGKPRQKGDTSIRLNKYSSQLPIEQNRNLKHNYKLVKGMPHVFNNLNVPLAESHVPIKSVKYVLSGYEDAVPPSKTHNMSHSETGMESPDKQNNIIDIGFSPRKIQTFDEWYTDQIKILRSQRPLKVNAVNVHLFKQHLLNVLYENGIQLSSDGYFLYDFNGNIFKISNLRLRPVLFGESMDYQWTNTKLCVIPYDLPYLEAILVTLIYSSRVLAIVPFRSENNFFFNPQGKIAPLCSQSNCNTHENYRSGLHEKGDISSDINNTVDTKDNDENSYTTEEKSKKLIEEEQPVHSNNIESRIDNTYVATNMDLPVKSSAKPLQVRTGDQNTFHLISPPNDSGYWTHPIYYDNKNNFVSHKIPEYGVNVRSDLSEKEEPTILRRLFNTKIFNKDNLHTEETSNQIAEEVEPLFTQDITSKNDYSYMTANNDVPLEESLKSESDSQIILLTPTFTNDAHNDDRSGDTNEERLPVIDNKPLYYSNDITSNNDYNRNRNDLNEISVIEEGKTSEDFYISQESPKQPDGEDYEMLSIRIVGGNPATSSGTPVSSKGRSGSDF